LRRLALATGWLAILLLGLAVVDFVRRMGPSLPTGPVARAVVFSGQYDRIPPALVLVASGEVGGVFVSGVNSGVGLSPERFVLLFGPEAPWLPAALSDGRIELGTEATTTLENAHETTCWYRRAGVPGPIMLITSRGHMPRASWALERALPGIQIHRRPVDSAAAVSPWRHEFPRYLATRIMLLVPGPRTPDCPVQ